MKLQRIRIEQFRKFADPVEISGLEPGLNVLHGPNEAGKSTIAQAIRTLFFERHNTRGDFVHEIAPLGMAAPAPSIEIDFKLGDADAKASKIFFQAPRASVVVDGDRWDGAEADEALARTLGFGLSGRGASRAETHGIPGLLWIEQGASASLDEPVGHAASSLEERLKSVLGEIADAGGGRLANAIRAELGALRTATGKDRGALAEAASACEAAVQQRDALREHATRFRTLTDSLARDIAERDRLERDKPWEGYERGKREAEARKAALEPQQRELEANRRSLGEIGARIDGLHQQNRSYDQDLKALAELRAQLVAVESACQQAGQALQAAEARRTQARHERDAARAQQQAAQQQQRRIELDTELGRIAAEIRRAGDVLAKGQEFAASLADLRQQAGAVKLSRADLKKLEKLEQQRHENRIQREAIATRLAYRLDAGRRIDAGDLGFLQGEATALITAPVRLRIEGVGEIDISPGGEDIARLAEEARQLADAAGELCARLGVRDLAEAQQRHARFTELERAIELLETQRATVLEGKEDAAWREVLAEAQGRHAACAHQLAGLPQGEGGMTLEAAVRRLQEAEAELRQADASVEARRHEANDAELQRARLQAGVAAQSQRLETDEARTAAERRQRDFAEAVARKDALAAEIARAETALAEANPDLIEADIQRYAQALRQVADERRELDRKIEAGRTQLEMLGADGVDEQLAAAEEQVRRLERRRDHYRLRADALKLLDERLSAQQQARVQRLYAPLRGKIEHYLKILFPGADIAVDIDRLRPSALQRDGSELAFDAHSHGTREQLGVIARFAYADLLKQAGQPTLLILDDALVHSDAARREQMKRIIHDASKRHQILLFTCHPEDWRDAGAQRMIDVTGIDAR